MKQAEEIQYVKLQQFLHLIISNSPALPQCIGNKSGQNDLGVQIHSVFLLLRGDWIQM